MNNLRGSIKDLPIRHNHMANLRVWFCTIKEPPKVFLAYRWAFTYGKKTQNLCGIILMITIYIRKQGCSTLLAVRHRGNGKNRKISTVDETPVFPHHSARVNNLKIWADICMKNLP